MGLYNNKGITMKRFFLSLVFVSLCVSHACAGMVFFCDPSRGYYGTTPRWYPGADNIVEFDIADTYYMSYYGWSNGGPIGTIPFLISQAPDGLFSNPTSGGPLPNGSKVIAQFSDGSCVVTVSNATGSGYVSYETASSCLNKANSSCGNRASCYNNGTSIASDTSNKFQAGQLAPAAPETWWSWGGATPVIQNTSTMAAHLLPVYWPYQAPYTSRQKMNNSAMVQMFANGTQGQISVGIGDTVNITVSVYGSLCQGYGVDYWIAAKQPDGSEYYLVSGVWQTTIGVAGQGGNMDFGQVSVYNGPMGEIGATDFYFCIDTQANGVLDRPLMCATVRVYAQ